MNEIIIIALGGFGGGMVRGLVGVLKALRMGRKVKKRYLLTTLALSALLGVVAGLFIENDIRFSILAGYVGSDFLESLYKVRFNQKYKGKAY